MELLKVEGISKQYSNHQALSDVSISIPEKSIFGLLGPNGAGKTTLIRIITQIIAADEGTVLLEGKPMGRNDIVKIGYLPEERGLYKKMKVGEHLLYLARLKGLSKQVATEKLKFWGKKFEVDTWWGKKVEDLSKGMQQKIQFIATVLHNPRLIILDEPFSGFDPINANLIKDEILNLREKGCTIIFSTHRMESVEELCDHIALINKSRKILEGQTQQIRSAFKTNTFIVDHYKPLNDFSGNFTVLGTKKLEEGSYQTTIQLNARTGTNELLKGLIEHVEVHGFVEKIPTMNQIFISKVNEQAHE